MAKPLVKLCDLSRKVTVGGEYYLGNAAPLVRRKLLAWSLTHVRNGRTGAPVIAATVGETSSGSVTNLAQNVSAPSTTAGGSRVSNCDRRAAGAISSNRNGRPSTSPIICTCSTWVSVRGPVSKYFAPPCPSPVSTQRHGRDVLLVNRSPCARALELGHDMATGIPRRPGHQNRPGDGLAVNVLEVSMVDGAQESTPCPIRECSPGKDALLVRLSSPMQSFIAPNFLDLSFAVTCPASERVG